MHLSGAKIKIFFYISKKYACPDKVFQALQPTVQKLSYGKPARCLHAHAVTGGRLAAVGVIIIDALGFLNLSVE